MVEPDDDADSLPPNRPRPRVPLIDTFVPEPDDHDDEPAPRPAARRMTRRDLPTPELEDRDDIGGASKRSARQTPLIDTFGPEPDGHDDDDAPPAPSVRAPPQKPPSVAERLLFLPVELLALICRIPGLIVWVMMPGMAVTVGLVPCDHDPLAGPRPDGLAPCRGASRYRNPFLFRLFCRRLLRTQTADGRRLCACTASDTPVFRPALCAVLLLILGLVGVTAGIAWGVVRLSTLTATTQAATPPPPTSKKPQAAVTKGRSSSQERATALVASAREFEAHDAFASARIQLKNALALAPKDTSLLLELADCAAKCGKREEAHETLTTALTLDPKCAEAVRQLAILAAAGDDFAEALVRLEQLAVLQPPDAATLRLRGMCLKALNDVPAARQAMAAAVKLEPDNLDGLVTLGSLELRQHDPAAAEPHFRRALALKPALATAQVGMAGALLERKDYAQAERLIEGWLRTYPEVNDLLPILGEVHTAAGNLDAAASVFRRKPGGRWTSPYAQDERLRGVLRLGERLVAADRTDEAIALYRDILAQQPDLFDVRRRLIQLFVAAHRPDDAYAAAVQCATQFRDPVGAGLLQAELFLDQGFTTLAEQQCAAALAAGAKDPRMRLAGKLRARIALNARNLARAQSELEEYLKTMPEDLECETWLADCYRDQGRKDDAVKRLRDAAARFPDESLPDLVLGGWFQADGQRDAAIACYRSAVKRSPNNLPALCALALLLGAQENTVDEALDFAGKARAFYPKNPYAADALGWVLFRRGSLEQSLALLSDAATQQAANPQIRYHLARALLKLGNKDEALRSVQVALATPVAFGERPEAEALLRELRPAPPPSPVPGHP